VQGAGAARAYLAIWVLAALTAAPVWAQNLLANPGFEEGLGPDGAPKSWARYGGGAEGTELRLTDEALAGQAALALVDQADALRDPRYSIGVVQEVPARGGAHYRALLRAKPVVRSADRAVILRLEFLPSERDFTAAVAPKLGAGFQLANLLALAPQDTTAVRLYIYTANIARSETILDEVSLTELSPEQYRKYAPLEPYNSSGIAEVYPIPRQTVLAEGGEPQATIVAAEGANYLDLAYRLQREARARSGADLPVVVDVTGVDLATRPNLVVLGNMSNNRVIERLYWTKATTVDSAWAAPGAYLVQTVTEPYAYPEAGQIAILGGRGPAEVQKAIEDFVAHLEGQQRLVAPNRYFAYDPEHPTTAGSERSAEAISSDSQAWQRLSQTGPAYLRDGVGGAGIREALLGLAGFYADDPKRQLADSEVAEAAELFYLWQGVEGDQVFSDEDRLVITNTLLAILYSLPARIPGYHRLDVNPTIISPETSRPLLGLYYGARYFRHHYGNVDERMTTFLSKCQQAFSAQYASYKSKADALEAQTSALRDTADYALNENDLTMFGNGTVRQWADYIMLTSSPLGGDREDVALPYALWYYRDGRYLARLQELHRGYQSPFGEQVQPQPLRAEAWSAYAPLTKPVFDLRLPEPIYGGPKQAPTVSDQRAFDKLALRTAGPMGQYLLLDGYGRGEGGHYDTNAIVSFVDRGAHCLLDGGQWARSTTEHSMVSVLKDGLAPDTVPPVAAVVYLADFRDLSIVQTVVRDYNGVDWYRNLFWRHGGPLVVLDALQALAGGEFQFDCHYMVNTWWDREAQPQGGMLSVQLQRGWLSPWGSDPGLEDRNRALFHLVSDTDAGLELRASALPAAREPVRQRRRVQLAEAGVAGFHNLLCTSQTGSPPGYGLHRAGERACVISGPGDSLAYAGVRGVGLPFNDVVLGADVFYVTPERIVAMNLAEVAWGRAIMSAKGPLSVDLDLRTGQADVIAEGKGVLRLMGEREGEVRVDGQVVPAKYYKGDLLAVPIAKGRHMVEVNPWVVDQSLAGRIAADLADLKAAAPLYVPKRPLGATENLAELWSRPPTKSASGPLLVSDINGDRVAEILMAVGKDLRCLAPDGTELWTFDAYAEIRAVAEVAGQAGDQAKLVLATDADVVALTGSGQEVRRKTLARRPAPYYAGPVLLRVLERAHEGAAGGPCILVAMPPAQLVWLEGDWQEPRITELSARPTHLEVADLNGDRTEEILVGTEDGKLHVFSAQGERMPGTEVEPGEVVFRVTDLNDDGVADMLVGSTGGVLTSTPFGRLPSWAFRNYGYGPVDMAIGDLDRDGQDEIALASDSGYLYVLGPDGQLKFMDHAEGPITCVAVGHLTDKRRLAACYGSDDGSVRVVEGAGERPAQFWVGEPVKRLALADLTGDGLMEIIAAGPSGDLHVLKYQKGAGLARQR